MPAPSPCRIDGRCGTRCECLRTFSFTIHWQRFATGVASPLRQIGAFEKSNFWQGRLEPRASARWAVELFGPAFRAGIAGLEVLGALVVKLSDGSASGGNSLHDHGSFLAKQDQRFEWRRVPLRSLSHLTVRHASVVTASHRPRCYG